MIPSSQNDAVAFTTTHWRVVLKAQDRTPAAETALESLCRTYWRPIYTFVRREGIGPEEAKDVTQRFFALILERKDFHSVRQEKGRLRSFLLASLKHFMANERGDAATIKRGGGRTLISLDDVICARGEVKTNRSRVCRLFRAHPVLRRDASRRE